MAKMDLHLVPDEPVAAPLGEDQPALKASELIFAELCGRVGEVGTHRSTVTERPQYRYGNSCIKQRLCKVLGGKHCRRLGHRQRGRRVAQDALARSAPGWIRGTLP